MKCFFTFVILTLITISSAISAEVISDVGSKPNFFKSNMARIELEIPEGWHFMNNEVVAERRATAKLKDKQMQDAIQNLASAPLVAATMYPEPYESLNPSIQVLVRPLGKVKGATASQILGIIKPFLEKLFEEFELLEPITDFELDGINAARFSARYTVQNQEGTIFHTRSIMMVVPRGNYMYQFSFSSPPEGKNLLSKEIVNRFINSVHFIE
ncbi:hypothetical protein [Psychromonas aquimarina]|uniref:hypothetical protein n=1 Tax=Psychromonas aquimarina TaxID=444919 RepID=UPI0004146655|nr:hypothetical protein [Psychromonas aquimarina]